MNGRTLRPGTTSETPAEQETLPRELRTALVAIPMVLPLRVMSRPTVLASDLVPTTPTFTPECPLPCQPEIMEAAAGNWDPGPRSGKARAMAPISRRTVIPGSTTQSYREGDLVGVLVGALLATDQHIWDREEGFRGVSFYWMTVWFPQGRGAANPERERTGTDSNCRAIQEDSLDIHTGTKAPEGGVHGVPSTRRDLHGCATSPGESRLREGNPVGEPGSNSLKGAWKRLPMSKELGRKPGRRDIPRAFLLKSAYRGTLGAIFPSLSRVSKSRSFDRRVRARPGGTGIREVATHSTSCIASGMKSHKDSFFELIPTFLDLVRSIFAAL